MRIEVDYKYPEPVIATMYNENGTQFMKSEVKVKVPARPYYEPSNKLSCTDLQYLKWKDKVFDKISSAVVKSLPEGLYGTINVNINMEKYHGLW